MHYIPSFTCFSLYHWENCHYDCFLLFQIGSKGLGDQKSQTPHVSMMKILKPGSFLFCCLQSGME